MQTIFSDILSLEKKCMEQFASFLERDIHNEANFEQFASSPELKPNPEE
jgi:hypothetical protein